MFSYRHREAMRFGIGEWEFNDHELHIQEDEDNERFLELLSKQPKLLQSQIFPFDPKAEREANVSMAERLNAGRVRGQRQQVFKGGAQDSTGSIDGPKGEGGGLARQELLRQQAETDRLEREKTEEDDRLKREAFKRENDERARIAEEEQAIKDKEAAAARAKIEEAARLEAEKLEAQKQAQVDEKTRQAAPATPAAAAAKK